MAKLQNIFKNLGKSPSQIHTPNIYAESLAETKAKGDYEKSVAALSPITYQKANKFNFLFARGYAVLYHFVSTLLGLATVIMLAYLFSGIGGLGNYPELLLWAMFGLTFIILSALLIGIEVFKGSLAKSIFKNLVTGAKVKTSPLLALVMVMVFSILVSAVGGGLLSYSMNDKSTQINQNYSVQADSLQKLHTDNLQAVNASIEAYKANLSKGSYWAKFSTREKLDKAIEVRNELLKATTNNQQKMNLSKEKEIGANAGEGKKYALISAILVLFFELLSMLAYWYQYAYHANCEKEAVNFEILTVSSPQLSVSNNENKEWKNELKELLQSVLNGNNQFQLASNTVTPNLSKVGFSFGANKDNNDLRITSIVNDLRSESNIIHEGTKVCVHCGKAFYPKIHFQKYCIEECRIEAWQKKTGKKFNKKKGGKN